MNTSCSASASRRSLRVGLWLAGLFLLCFLYFLPRPADWNQDSRLDMTLALVNHGTIAIDAYHWNTQDDDYVHGHYYSNKAPGQSLVGVPIYIAYRAVFGVWQGRSAANDIGLARTWNTLYYSYYILQCVESLYTVAIPAMLFLLLFFWFLGQFSTSVRNRVTLTLALGLGTSVFPYSQVLYAHVPVAGLLFAGFALVYSLAHGDSSSAARANWLTTHPRLAAFLAGLALGGAILLEYPAALVALCVAVYAVWRLPRGLSVLVAAGGAPMALALLGYDIAAFHNPLITGYSIHSKVWNQVGTGVGGTAFTWPPRLDAIFGMTFSPYRGLFFLSPFLLLAVPGYILWARKGGRDWLVCLIVPPVLLLTMAMDAYWSAGYAVGPRILIPMLPFLVLPVIFVLDRVVSRLGRIGIYALMAVSALNVWIETIGGRGYPPTSVANPLFQYSLPALAHGTMPINLGTIVLYPFVGMNSKLTILPLVLLLAFWSLAMLAPAIFGRSGQSAHPAVATSTG